MSVNVNSLIRYSHNLLDVGNLSFSLPTAYQYISLFPGDWNEGREQDLQAQGRAVQGQSTWRPYQRAEHPPKHGL